LSTRTAVGRAEHGSDAKLFHDLPPDTGVGPHRHAFEHDRGGSVDERAIDDVRVPDHPADIRRAEVHLTGSEQEDVTHRCGERNRVAAGIALHAFRFSRRALVYKT
jgi:hypothetical protein